MNRRNFFATSILSLTAMMGMKKVSAAACVQGTAPAGKKVAKNKERLDYVLNAADAKGNAKYKDGSTCANCKFYKKDKEETGYAPCPMLANKYVSACGWCKTYAAAK